MNTLTQSLEDYLKAIFIVGFKKKIVRVKDIAEFLNVKTSSVVVAIGRLADKNLVVHERYGYLELTQKGIAVTRGIYKKYKELYKFCNEILGISPEVAARDACKIEHCISKETLNKIAKFIKFIESYPEEHQIWLKSFKY